MSNKILLKNRKAWHEYEILEKFEAGVSLLGTEVKSLRAGQGKIVDAFCNITKDLELELLEMHISPYGFGNRNNHEPNRKRKLLMHKKEIFKLYAQVREKGLTIVPLSFYFKKNHIKVEIGLCRGKKLHDKRASLKEKDAKRDMDRIAKNW